jgi:hypothetical protein
VEDPNTYLVPTGDGKNQIAIDLVEIIKAEQRLKDVAIVNQFTAPELLSTFNGTWLELNRSVTQLTYQRNVAENHHKNAIADAKLAATDDYLRSLGHSKGSADLRNAVVQKNPEVQATKERLDEIAFVLETLRGKMDAFYNGYNSVKKLTDSRTLPGKHYGDVNRPETFAPPPKQVPVEKQVAQDPDLEPLSAGFSARY